MLLLIDNYDSFTFNLVHGLAELDRGLEIVVVRNDEISLTRAAALNPRYLVISPGPRTPAHTGICPQLVAHFRGRIPILGVCLGHQVIAHVHGITVGRCARLVHGKTSQIHHDGLGIFHGLPNPFPAARYHSLIIDPAALTDDFTIAAWTDQQEPMAIRWTPRSNVIHSESVSMAPMDGVQFHPESFLTPCGPQLLGNFLRGSAAMQSRSQASASA